MEITPPIVDQDFVDAVEQRVGYGAGAWDMIDPIELCQAVLAEAALRHPPILMPKLNPEEIEAFRGKWTPMQLSVIQIPDSGQPQPPFPPLPQPE